MSGPEARFMIEQKLYSVKSGWCQIVFLSGVWPGDDQGAGNGCEVVADGGGKAQGLGHGAQGGGLAEATFEDGGAVRGEAVREIGQNRTVGLQPIAAAIERGGGLILRDIRHQAGDVSAWDIRRVGQDQIEPAGERGGPIGHDEMAARRETQRLGVGAGELGGGGDPVDPNAVGGAKFGEGGEQQRAGAGAEIENPCHVIALRKLGEGGFDQGFAVGAGDQGGGADGEGEGPEIGVAGEKGERFMGGAAGDEVLGGLGLDFGDLIAEQESLDAAAERKSEQQAGFAAGLLNAGGAQLGAEAGEQAGGGLAVQDWAFKIGRRVWRPGHGRSGLR